MTTATARRTGTSTNTKTSAADATPTVHSVTKPTGTYTTGRRALVIFSVSALGSNLDATIAAPDGSWTIIDALNDLGGSNSSKIYAFIKTCTAAEPASWDFIITGSATGYQAVAYPLLIADTSGYDSESGCLAVGVSTNLRDTKSITTDAPALVIAAYADKTPSTYVGTGAELVDTNQGGASLMVEDCGVIAAGTFSKQATASGASSVGVNFIIAFYHSTKTTGAVDTFFNTNPFYIAHRGGSADFEECTQAAYTSAIGLGAKALEVPTWRTSDGVWVINHDQTTTRYNSVVDIPTSTWAALSALRTTVGNHQMMRLDNWLATFNSSAYIGVMDNKVMAAPSEWLDMLDQAGGPERFCIKNVYSSNAHVTAKERGYKTWGYYYDADVVNLDASHVNWDFLALDFNATQANWNLVLAKGKRTTAHVCLSAAHIATATSKGAHGFMTGKLVGVLPAVVSSVAKSKNDTIFDELVTAGHTVGSIADRERKRLLAKAALAEPQRLSLNDLYRINAERPRL